MKISVLLACLLLLTALLAGCQRGAPVQNASAALPPDLVAQAQAEATAILQQARATALVQQARSQAAALVQTPQEQPTLPVAVAVETIPEPTVAAPAQAVSTPDPAAPPAMPTNVVLEAPIIARQGDVELVNVTFAADSGFIMINFIAPPKLSSELYQGRISVTDEATNEVYDEIPVMPVIGPLIGRPALEGQRSYAMLVNRPPWLRPGALVTVVIADATFEHIPVQ